MLEDLKDPIGRVDIPANISQNDIKWISNKEQVFLTTPAQFNY